MSSSVLRVILSVLDVQQEEVGWGRLHGGRDGVSFQVDGRGSGVLVPASLWKTTETIRLLS